MRMFERLGIVSGYEYLTDEREKQVDEGQRNRIHEKVDEAFGIK